MTKELYNTGVCTYCGQAISLDQEYDSPEEANAAATAICNCDVAKAERNLRREIEGAKNKVYRLFGETAGGWGFEPIQQETIDLMLGAVELVARDHIDSMTINCRGEYKATIAMTGKGKIKVSRSETHVGTLE